MKQPTCRELTAFLDGFLAGALTLETRAAFQWHLTRCPACAAYLQGYRETGRLAAAAGGDTDRAGQLPEQLVRAILSARLTMPGAEPALGLDRGRGDPAVSFEREALPHRGSLRRTAYRLTRNACDAEDLAQEVLLRAFRAWSSYTPGTNVRGWLYTILFRAHTDGLRRRMRSVKTVELVGQGPAVAPAEQALFPGDRPLSRALRELPDVFRRAVLLRDVGDLSYREIARALGVPAGTVMSRIHRGRALLRQSLSA